MFPDRKIIKFACKSALAFAVLLLRYLLPKPPSQSTQKDRRVAAIVLSWKRPLNIPLVVRGLKRQTFIDDILVWHNHPSRFWCPGVSNFFSPKNFGCVIRHDLAAILPDYDYFVFCDDDLYLTQDASEAMNRAIDDYGPTSVIGIFGKDMNMNTPDQPYSAGQERIAGNDTLKTDIVKGRFHIVSRENIKALFEEHRSGDFNETEDDLRLNIFVQLRHQRPGILVPVYRKYKDLPQQHAVFSRKNHFEKRDQVIKDAIEEGWLPNSRKDQKSA